MRDARVDDIIRRCYSDIEVRDRDGSRGRGVTNLKRIFGWPTDLPVAVDALASTVDGEAHGVASADTGASPLTALVAFRLGLPAVFMRSQPKEHLLSYGGDDATNHPQLSGERLPNGTPIHVIDDLVHSAATLTSAVATLWEAGLVVNTASSLLASPPEALAGAIHALRLHLTALAVTSELFY